MPDRQLLDYVRKERAIGVSDDAIRQNLTASGWSAPDVADALATNQNVVAPLQGQTAAANIAAEPHGKVWFWSVLVAVSVIGIGSIVMLAFFNTARSRGSRTLDTSTLNNTEIPTGWQIFTPENARFSVLIPAPPSSNSRNSTTEDGKNISFSATVYNSMQSDGAAVFAIADYDYKDAIDILDPDSVLQSFLDTVINAPSTGETRKLVSSSHVTVETHPALDFVVQNAGSLTSGRIILVNDTSVYLLFETYGSDSYNDQDYQAFINSFQPRS